ncbi:MAG: glycosyltransferase [Patescibacteria group bacterium]|nr:glycosyltransferase [Patescibacteria group bacterium]
MKKEVSIFTGLVQVDKNLVGTAVIYKKLADIFISLGYKVNLIIPSSTDLTSDQINFYLYNSNNNKKLIKSSNLVIFGAYPPVEPLLYAHRHKKIIVSYLWSLAPIGSLEFRDFNSQQKQANLHEYISASYNLSLLLSDKIFCRDEGARKVILGSLVTLGRVNLLNYKDDKTLNNLLAVAPFGISNQKAKLTKHLIRTPELNIKADDFVLLWNGGIWNWNDGETLIKAMSKINNDKIKLVFQGFSHPGKAGQLSLKARKSLALAKKLDLINKNIFFVKEWAPYDERANYLLDSNIGVVSSPNIPEANLFLKTRIYDYLWADLPILLNDCEAFAPLIADKQLGLVVKTGDALDWVKKINTLVNDKKLLKNIVANIKKYKDEITWQQALRPVRAFALKPHLAADKKSNYSQLFKNSIIVNEGIIKNKKI